MGYTQWFEAVIAPLRAAIAHEKDCIASLLHTPLRALARAKATFVAPALVWTYDDPLWPLHAAHDVLEIKADFNDLRLRAIAYIEDAIDAQDLLDEGQPEADILRRIIAERLADVEKFLGAK